MQEGGKWPDKAAECDIRDCSALQKYQREGVNWLVFNWYSNSYRQLSWHHTKLIAHNHCYTESEGVVLLQCQVWLVASC